MAADALIQAALYGHLKALELPTALPIAPEGRDFDPKGKAYLRPTYMPASTDAPYLSDDDDLILSGLFQISVFWPEDNGLTEALTVAAAISVHFRRGTQLVPDGIDLRLSRAPSTLPAIQEPGWLQVPVRATWEACAPVTA